MWDSSTVLWKSLSFTLSSLQAFWINVITQNKRKPVIPGNLTNAIVGHILQHLLSKVSKNRMQDQVKEMEWKLVPQFEIFCEFPILEFYLFVNSTHMPII